MLLAQRHDNWLADGLQITRKPLIFIGPQWLQFAKKTREINVTPQTTNLLITQPVVFPGSGWGLDLGLCTLLAENGFQRCAGLFHDDVRLVL